MSPTAHSSPSRIHFHLWVHATWYQVFGMSDQDYVHNHKKLVNHLIHLLGSFQPSSNSLKSHDPFQDHKLTQEDMQTARIWDQPNMLHSCVSNSFLCVHECLQRIIDGGDNSVIHGNYDYAKKDKPTKQPVVWRRKMICHYLTPNSDMPFNPFFNSFFLCHKRCKCGEWPALFHVFIIILVQVVEMIGQREHINKNMICVSH